MDSQTHQGGFYTNLVLNDEDTFIEFTNKECEHQESPPQVEVQPPQVEVHELTGKKSQRGGNFTVNEDNMLVSAWSCVALDAVTGNEQTHKTYWERICAHYHKHKTFDSNRTNTSLMNRWSVIQLAVNKFCGYLDQVQRRQPSGLNEIDKVCYNYAFSLIYLDYVISIPKDFNYVAFIIFFRLPKQK
jgi:hypothetical protein